MKVASIGSSNLQSFGALRPDKTSISEGVFKEVINTPVVQKFGKKYNATVGIEKFLSSDNTNKNRFALKFEDIEPRNIFLKLKDFLTGKKYMPIYLKTRAENEKMFLSKLSNMHSDSVMDIMSTKKISF